MKPPVRWTRAFTWIGLIALPWTLSFGESDAQSPQDELSELKAQAEQGNASAMHHLAEKYRYGWDVSKDPAVAAQRYIKSADARAYEQEMRHDGRVSDQWIAETVEYASSEAAEREELISYSAFGLEFEYPSTMTVTPKEAQALKSLTVEGEDPLRVIMQIYPKGTLAWKVEEAILSELRSGFQSRGAEILESSGQEITVRLGEVCPGCQGKALQVRISGEGETMHTWVFAFMLQDHAVAVIFQNALKEGQPFRDEEPAKKLFQAISQSLRQKRQ